MFKFLEFFSIKLKFFMLLTIPMSALCIFSAISLFELFSQKNNLVLLKNHISKAEKMSGVIHELQKERGMSFGYLTAPSETKKQNIIFQTKAVDKSVLELKNFLAINKMDTKIMDIFAGLPPLRNKIADTSIQKQEIMAYYSDIIEKLSSGVLRTQQEAEDFDLKNILLSHYYLLGAKESLGKTRALLNSVFIQDRFMDDALEAFIKNKTSYEINLHRFKEVATPQTREFFDTQYKTDSVLKTHNMIELAKEKLKIGEFGIDSVVWFGQATNSIDALYAVEQNNIKSMHANIENLKSKISQKIISIIMALSIFGIFMLLFMYAVLSSILSKLGVMQSTTKELASSGGDLTKRLAVTGRDELVGMAKSINLFIETTQSLVKKAKSAVEENASISSELLQAATSVGRKAEEAARATKESYLKNKAMMQIMAESYQGVVGVKSNMVRVGGSLFDSKISSLQCWFR